MSLGNRRRWVHFWQKKLRPQVGAKKYGCFR